MTQTKTRAPNQGGLLVSAPPPERVLKRRELAHGDRPLYL